MIYNKTVSPTSFQTTNTSETRASRWRAITYPRASTIAYLRIRQNSKCYLQSSSLWLFSVIVSRFELQKPRRSCVTIKKKKKKKKKKKDPKSYFLTSGDSYIHVYRHARGKIFCTTVFYSSLPLIWYATWLCLYKKDFGPFRATSPGPAPEVTSKFRMCSSSPHP